MKKIKIPKYEKPKEEETRFTEKNTDIQEIMKEELFDTLINKQLPKGQIYDVLIKNAAIFMVNAGVGIESARKIFKLFHKGKVTTSQINCYIGWYNSAKKGKYAEFNKREINHWCTKFKFPLIYPDVKSLRQEREESEKEVEEKYVKDKPINFIEEKNLAYNTKHLAKFNEVDYALDLQGEEYSIIKKIVWYQFLSFPCRKIIVRLGGVETDLRFHASYTIPTGCGKKEILNTQREASLGINTDFQSPTTYHPENLVGKKIRRKVPTGETTKNGKAKYKYVLLDNPGWFNADVIVFEEASNLIKSNDPKMEESRRLFCNALDIFGKNMVSKGSVDILPEERLSYYPNCVVSIFCQPYHVDETLWGSGFLRRFFIGYTKFPNTIKPEEFIKKISEYSHEGHCEAISKIVEYLNEIKTFVDEENFGVTFSEEAKKLITDYHIQLLMQISTHSAKIKPLLQNLRYHLLNKLVMLSSFQAISRLRSEVQPVDVKFAFMDLTEFLYHFLMYIDDLVIGLLNFSSDWIGSKVEDRMCLEWLQSEGAISEEKTTTEIGDFIAKISEFCNISIDGARKRFYKYFEKGWIKKFHRWQKWYAYVVFNHTDNSGNTYPQVKIKNKSKYYEIVNSYNDLCSSITSITTMMENDIKPSKKRGNKKDKSISMVKYDQELSDLHKFMGEKIPKPDFEQRFPIEVINKWQADGTIAEFGEHFMIMGVDENDNT